MLSERSHSFENHDVSVIVCKGTPWFRAYDVTAALDYKRSALAVRQHVREKYIRTLIELQGEVLESNAVNHSFHPERSGRPPVIHK